MEQTKPQNPKSTTESTTTFSRFVRFRNRLERNKIFFETITALLLSGMAVILSYVQYTEAERERSIQETAHWSELHDAMLDFIDLTDPSKHGLAEIMGQGLNAFRGLSKKEMVSWLNTALRILNSQNSNPVLIESKTCLGYWRNAISTARINLRLLRWMTGPETEDTQKQRADRFVETVSSIFRDVLFVWDKIVLDSDEVSATGGRPNYNNSKSK